tara:strand:+ start:3836 stop:4417 length:582 start_codon:yes stop_codon:yes gene_type:complete
MGIHKPGEGYFAFRYGTGEAGEMMKRYGVARAKSVKPSAQTSVSKTRTVGEVRRDIAAAMRNDYDTRRTMEAAALAGNKDARKFAKKGYKSENIFDAHSTMGDLEKEYGKEYGAGLTFAAVKDDRKALTKKFTAMSAEDQQKGTKSSKEKDFNAAPSPQVQAAKERVAAYQASNGGSEPSPYGKYAQRSTKFF